MSKLINQVVAVTTGPGQRPLSFVWRRSRYHVAEVLDSWAEIGRWWELEPEVTAWRIRVGDGGVYELAMAHKQPPEWKLMVIYD